MSKKRSKTFAIGDIHGCFEQLEQMLNTLHEMFNGGTVVFLGDYIDRGPDSKKVLDKLMELTQSTPNDKWHYICLKGNHEEMMLASYAASKAGSDGPIYMWVQNGGEQTLESMGDAPFKPYKKWMKSLPTIYYDKYRVMAHAGVNPAEAIDDQDEDFLLWARVNGKETWHHPNTDYWGRHLVHGHTPIDPTQALTVGNRTDVDTACVFGGKLTCAVFDDDTPGGPVSIIQVKGPPYART